MPELPRDVDDVVRRALAEDLGLGGDVTSLAVVPPGRRCRGRFEARASGVMAGLPVVERVFREVDRTVIFTPQAEDGDLIRTGAVLAEVGGPARSVLAAERVALNFLGHLSGVATLTRRFVGAVSDTESVVVCTRKTLPGLRSLQRYAVECGGGRLHRFGLSDGVLIKDNHVRLAAGVGEAVRRARERAPHPLRVQVEVETVQELQEAIDAGADSVLLDNADPDTVFRAVGIVDGRIPMEVSGGITLETIGKIAAMGPLLISVGRLTHSAPALDVSLEIES